MGSAAPSSPHAAIVVALGFRQRRSLNTGLFRLYQRLSDEFYDRRQTLILLRRWDDSADAAAELLRHRDPAEVYFVGYSYGVGWYLPQLASALASRGRRIDAAWLIDPVPRWRLPLLKWISLTRWGTFELSPAVDRAYVYRQVNAPPYGRRVRPTDGTVASRMQPIEHRMVFGSQVNLRDHATEPLQRQHVLADADHNWIDDDERVHTDVLDLLRARMARSARQHAHTDTEAH